MTEPADKLIDWTRVEQLFPDLQQLPTAQRPAFLDRHCRNDPALRRELESLLHASSTDSLLDTAPQWLSPAQGDEISECRPGERIGAWQVVRLLGRGGMGEVYLAERRDGGFEQRAAIKLVRADAAQHVERFEAERRILAQLDHPNIAHLLDGGVTSTGRPYMAMEHVEGRHLRAYCSDRHLDLDARLALFEQICQAVAYAHAHLVIHRDLKPGNILVTPQGRVKLLDFGVAKLLDPGSGEATQTAPFTPDHAAPEQLQGLPVTTAIDVYALGVVLYELLSGRPPFSFGSMSAASAVERLLREEPPLCSRAVADRPGAPPGPRQLGPRQLQGDLDAIVAKCLRKTPQHRYATVEALQEDLRRWRAKEPVSACGDALRYVARRWLARNRVAVGTAALVMLALTAGLTAAVWQAQRAQAEARRAETQADAARLNAARARSVKDFLVSIFTQEDPLRRDPRGAITLARAYADARRKVEAGEIKDLALQADLLDDFGEIEAGRGDLDAAQRLFELALQRATEAHGENHPAVAESLINLGVLAGYRGDILAGREPLERAVRLLEPYADVESTALANAISGLVSVRRAEGRDAEIIPMLERALALQRRDDPEGENVPAALHNLAVALLDRGRYAEAGPLLREGIAMIERRQGPDAGNLPHLLSGLESVLYAEGKFEEEAATCERRLALLRLHYPGDHPWVAAALEELGAIRVRQGRPDDGESLIREAIAVYERLDSPRVARAWRELGIALMERGQIDAAAEVFQRAVSLCTEHGLQKSIACLVAHANHASARSRLDNGKAGAALDEATAAVNALAAGTGTASEDYASALGARADVLSALGRANEALAVRREAHRILVALYGTAHPATLKSAQPLAPPAEGDRKAPP